MSHIRKLSDVNFWLATVALTLVGIVVPERYSILTFLGAIFAMLFEISDRLRELYALHRSAVETALPLLERMTLQARKATD